MSTTPHAQALAMAPPRAHGALLRSLVIGTVGFLTLVDLFAAQAILPSLTLAYGVMPASMGFAVNASTIGMAVAGAPDLGSFTALRIAQGVFMAAAFTLTMTYLAEQCSAEDSAGALAAYITGGVASNLIGRLVSASIADHLGLAANLYAFALLNLSGAALVYLSLQHTMPMTATGPARSPLASWVEHLKHAALRASFAIGFLILFAFVGTFTYVNFVLVREPVALRALRQHPGRGRRLSLAPEPVEVEGIRGL